MRQIAPRLRVSSQPRPELERPKEDEMSGWTLTLMVAIGLTGTARTGWAEAADPIPVCLCVINEAGVSSNVRTMAKAQTTRLYRSLGLTLVWTEADVEAVACRFVVKIVSHAPKDKRIDGGMMGVAVGTTATRPKVAYAFYERIQNFTQIIGTDPGLILGHVIAHEVGHMLLPTNAQAKSGLMRGGWDTDQALRAMKGSLTFTPQEVALIRRRLQ